MGIECVGCHKKLQEEALDECFSVYRCRRDHVFVCCKVECQRVLEKKCGKVSDYLCKIQHKLNNDGHTSALRRLPPCEREKLKEHTEAEANSYMICPEEVKACERSVPHCCYVMNRVGGFAKGDKGEVKRHVPQSASPEKFAEPENPGLIDDAFLMEIKLEEDEICDVGLQGALGGKVKKQKKGGKDKKSNVLLIDFKQAADDSSDAWFKANAHPPPLAKQFQSGSCFQSRSPTGFGAAQAWSAVARLSDTHATDNGQLQQDHHQPHPPDDAQRVERLMATTDCSESHAVDLLKSHSWNLEKAADVYFQEESAGDCPRWGPRSQGQQQQSVSHVQPAPAREAERLTRPAHQRGQEEQAVPERQTVQAPSQPPPPRLPLEWQAIWSEEQQAYYYWHTPTNHTTWEAPVVKVESAEEEPSAPAGGGVPRLTSRGSLVECGVEGTGPHQGGYRPRWRSLGRAPGSDDSRRPDEGPPLHRDFVKRILDKGHYICTRHWRPKPGLEACMRLWHGERVSVTWVDGQARGWAYGFVIDCPSTEGYFPQEVLEEVKHVPRYHGVGDQCGVAEIFEPPAEVGGYLSVAPGDVLKVLYPCDVPHVWAFVERVVAPVWSPHPEMGWVPESILVDLVDSDPAG